MKLFEIPVYALSRETLALRYEKEKEKLIRDYDLESTQSGDTRKINQIIETVTYPQRLWDYNHIVGYITIFIDRKDIRFEQYVPAKKIERYIWKNKKSKTFLMCNHLNGYHFNFTLLKSGEEIQSRLHAMLDEILQNVDNRFYVDVEAFKQADCLIDYAKLLEE